MVRWWENGVVGWWGGGKMGWWGGGVMGWWGDGVVGWWGGGLVGWWGGGLVDHVALSKKNIYKKYILHFCTKSANTTTPPHSTHLIMLDALDVQC